mmetsp:Transcript_10503/g.26003  ORF Transcript_10503/g.26003 Transcript_10503/m.26003 type:complete len:228 (-) Transcript_10503:302-985(-)
MQVLVGSRDKPRWSSEDSPHDTTLLLGRVLVDHESFRRVDHRRGEDADTLVLNGVEKHRVRPVDDLDGPRPLPDLHVGILISDVLAQLLVHPLVGRGDELGGAPHDAVLDGRVDPHAARIVALLARDHERLRGVNLRRRLRRDGLVCERVEEDGARARQHLDRAVALLHLEVRVVVGEVFHELLLHPLICRRRKARRALDDPHLQPVVVATLAVAGRLLADYQRLVR